MSKNLTFNEPREMVSEDLQEIMPDDAMNIYQVSFITVAMTLVNDDFILAGSLVGVEFTDLTTKIDVKTPTRDAFRFIERLITTGDRSLSKAILSHDESVVPFEHHEITSFKIVEIDAGSKTCVIALDLIKT